MDPTPTVQVQKAAKNKLQNTAGDQTTPIQHTKEKKKWATTNCLATNPTHHTSNGVDSGTIPSSPLRNHFFHKQIGQSSNFLQTSFHTHK